MYAKIEALLGGHNVAINASIAVADAVFFESFVGPSELDLARELIELGHD